MFLIFLESLMEINLGIDGHLNKLSSETVQLQHKLSQLKKKKKQEINEKASWH